MRDTRRISAALVGAILLVLVSACAGGGKNSMTVMMDVGYLPKHAPFFAAVERGFFRAEGIDVTIMPGSGSTNTVTSVETGRVDAGFADFGATIISQGRGARVKQVNLLQARSAYAVVAIEGNGINGWDDLRGKTLATEGAGAMTAMWPFAMSKLGLTEGDVHVVHASSGSKIPGLLARQWDANLALYISDQPAIDALGREAVVLKWSDLGIDLYGNGMVVSDKKLAENPDQVRRFNRAMQKGFLWSCAHPDEAAQDFRRQVSGFETDTVTLAIREQCSLNWGTGRSANDFGVMDDAGAQKMLDVAQQFLGLPEDSGLTPDKVYTNDFLAPLHRDETIPAP
ncbi:ABC transporter substrate-binding protein [Nocardia callitridis]|uniref:ABC transporter substrate-binding protein n=1 Tax=Nocardia callitridis TaxID=648753 RepID=A0ABP9K5G4_9NOCA